MNKTLAKCIVGSQLYGLQTPNSDIDYVSVYASHDLSVIIGLDRENNTEKVTNEQDNSYFEIRNFLSLCRKGSTKALELLYAPEDKFEILEDSFKILRDQKNHLFDSVKFLTSIRGYLDGEYRFAIGARTGKLGGQRKYTIDQYGYSPKNVCQMMRLYRASKHYVEYGVFPVNISDVDPEYHNSIYDIKINPQNYKLVDILYICKSLLDDYESIDYKNCKHSKYQPHIVNLNLLNIYNLKQVRR